MKKMTQCLLFTACALGVLTLANRLTAADSAAATASTPSCCGGMSGEMAGCTMTPMADTAKNTNGIPDLLKTCPVSKEKLGADMGAPFVFSYKGQEVKLCCKGCKKDFDKDPEKYIKLIRAADKK